MPLIYFILTVDYQGIRIRRKTYLVNLAGGNKRTDYVALSNTIIGIVLFLLVLDTLTTMVSYSDALSNLAAAGETGKESVESLE